MRNAGGMTLFTTSKPFRGLFAVIQTNALRSWTLLKPRPEIIIFGDEHGAAEIAQQLGLVHVPAVKTNRYGTPLVSDLFERAQALARHNLMCYVNADILLMDDFPAAIERASRLLDRSDFLGVGRKLQVERKELLNFEKGWDSRLREIARREGRYVTPDSDYFVFPKGLYRAIPPFAIGRCFWSSWFVYAARTQGNPVIDSTELVTAVEFRHDYSHAASTGHVPRLSGAEFELNRGLFRTCRYFTTVDATFVLTSKGLEPPPWHRRVQSMAARAHYYVYFLAKGRLYPYSIPLILLYRLGRWGVRRLKTIKWPTLRGELRPRPDHRG